MPELPEVETVARGLRHLAGKKLGLLEIIDSKVWFESELAPERLTGLKLLEVARRGKYILLRFEGRLTLVQHLRMTGKMLAKGSDQIPAAVSGAASSGVGKGLQIRCRFRFEGAEFWFFDTRRFGTLTLVADEDVYFRRKGIAPDPINEPARARAWFLEHMLASNKPAKAALLDQSIVAGVGNIYADEALHGRGIHPRTPAKKIREPEALWAEVLRILERSIQSGGSSIINYVNADGKRGTFSEMLLVYNRTGEPCGGCKGKVERIVLAGRSTHFCPRCQPRKAQVSAGKKRPIQGRLKRSQVASSATRGISAKPTPRSRSKRKSPRNF